MNRQDVYKLFCDILTKVSFYDYELDDELWVDCCDEYNYDHISCLNDIEWCRSGASKLVIALEGVDSYVIKIPLHGEAYYDSDEQRFVLEDRSEVEEWDYNYCELEAQKYIDMLQETNGFEKMFAATTFEGFYGMVPIYVSDRVQSHFCYRASDDSKNKVQQYKSDTHDNTFSDTLMSMFVECWGFDDTVELGRILREHEIDDDIIFRNCGLDANGRIVILDYSGFNS